jgi:hypothetical protein
MKTTNLTNEGRNASRLGMGRMGKWLLAASAAGSLCACVQVSAPDRPIVINLNINIRQEVIVRLQEDARRLIESNPGVF